MVGFDMKTIQKWGILGAIIGAVIPVVIALLSKWAIPGISITQATINVQVSTPSSAIYDWLLGIINYTPNVPGAIPFLGVTFSAMLVGALSVGIAFAAGAAIADLVGRLKGTKVMKVFVVTLAAGILGALITKSGFVIIPLVINAYLLGLILAVVDDQTTLNIIP